MRDVERVKPGGDSEDAGSGRGDLIVQCEVERVERDEDLRSSMNKRGDAVIEEQMELQAVVRMTFLEERLRRLSV